MKNIKYYILFASVLFIAAAVSYKPILRWQIEKRVSGIKFNDLSLNLSGITLSSVSVDKDWIQGTLDTVTSDFQGNHILIEGGSLSVNLDTHQKQKEDLSKKKRDIQFHGLSIKLLYREYNASLQGVRSSGENICFSEAKLENPALIATNGCFEKETKIADADQVKLEQLDFMGVQLRDLTAYKVKFNLNEKNIEANSVKTQLTFEKQTASVDANNIKVLKKEKVIHLNTLSVSHPWLSSDLTVFKNIDIQYLDKLKISLGTSHVQVDPDTLSFSGVEDCSTWIDSLPDNLKSPTLSHTKFSGKVDFSLSLRPKPSFNLKADCKAVCSSLPDLRVPFTYTAYTPSREPFERKSGRRTSEWIPIEFMGDMPLAVKTMEDPGFYSHKGFISQAFANSLSDNLKQGKFLRGGSTITMQLVKNIWLNRDKTLGRKVQEFFLAQAVESCYSKDEILELYLNVVEFGPNKYGVGSGSQYWFKKNPTELTPVEAFWMASILPKPSRTNPPNETSFNRIETLIKKLAEDGRVPEIMTDTFIDLEEDTSEN